MQRLNLLQIVQMEKLIFSTGDTCFQQILARIVPFAIVQIKSFPQPNQLWRLQSP